MVLVEDWDTFYSEAEKLYVEHPAHTRYVMKYRHCDGKLVLKVTNDRVCLKFETDQAQDVKRLEKLNSLFFTYMCGKDPHADTELDDNMGSPKPSSAGGVGQKSDRDRPTSAGDEAAAPAAAAGGSATKKKKKR